MRDVHKGQASYAGLDAVLRWRINHEESRAAGAPVSGSKKAVALGSDSTTIAFGANALFWYKASSDSEASDHAYATGIAMKDKRLHPSGRPRDAAPIINSMFKDGPGSAWEREVDHILRQAQTLASAFKAEEVGVSHFLKKLAQDERAQHALFATGVDYKALEYLLTVDIALAQASADEEEPVIGDEVLAVVRLAAQLGKEKKTLDPIADLVDAANLDRVSSAQLKRAAFKGPVSSHYVFLSQEPDLYTDEDLVDRHD